MEKIKKILRVAETLIRNDVTECLFEALHLSSGTTWNGGFGIDADFQVEICDNGRLFKQHAAYYLVHRCTKVPLMCWSRNHSKEEKIELLKRVQKMASSWKN